jgi:metal-sulfur cluster biosynthetic enzyme
MDDADPIHHGGLSRPQIDELVRDIADQVYDPCSMAIGLNVGLTEMGLVRQVAADPVGDGWNVRVRLRLTSPGCQYFFYFKQELERRLLGHSSIVGAAVDWDETLDWTPEDLAASAREKIERRRRLLEQSQRSAPSPVARTR